MLLGPFFLMFFQVVGTFGAARGQPEQREPDVIAVLIAIAGPIALLVVRRFPVQVLGGITLITSVYLARDYPYGPVLISMVVAVVINVLGGRRVAAWIAVAFLVTLHFLLPFGDFDWSWGQFAGVSAWALLILTAAEFGRARRERAVAARKARAESSRRQANEERLRIARELHDVVAHHMSLINVQAGVALHLIEKQPEKAEPALAAIKSASKEALSELRSLVGILREDGEVAPRAPASMLGSLDELIERSGFAGLAVTKEITGTERTLPTAVELAAFRIVQEAITNVVRHAEATRAGITIDYGPADLTVSIIDNGKGPGGVVDASGNGIRGMQERAAALGGNLSVAPGKPGGTRVRAVLPLDVNEENP